MCRFPTILALLAGVGVASLVQAGAAPLKIGSTCPNFMDLPGTDGKKHALGEYKQDFLVVCITCNHCPFAADYDERLVAFASKYAAAKDSKVGFIAINVNTGDEEKLDKMQARARDKKFNFPYLQDESQRLGKALNAHVTPEFYVFDKDRKLVYWGAMDDSLDPTNVKNRYLENAVDALLAGKAVPVPMTKARGCSIEYTQK